MIEVVVENLDGVQVATITRKTRDTYAIHTEDTSVEERIQEVIDRASTVGIPLSSTKLQRMEQGIKYQRMARWLKPGDEDFLQALADDLARHRLFAYTLEIKPAQ